ncbi:MAG: hypothetical protein IH940_03845, partial [Acidobacteria bacterium]|nr:hypothetical protein [Acidobacteriota bacterium]
ETPPNGVDQQRVILIPDEENYQPGETAQILVQAPFADAEGLLTISRHEILETRRFHVEGTSTVLDISIEDLHIPNLTVQVDLVGTTERTAVDGTPIEGAPDQPAFATGNIDLIIPPISRTLNVEAQPADDTVAPGGRTSVEVSVTDRSGKPVGGAELAVIVVDEAVLALSGYELGDPNDVFYKPIYSNVDARYGRDLIELLRPDLIEGTNVPTTGAATVEEEGGGYLGDAGDDSASAPADSIAQSTRDADSLAQTGSDDGTIEERVDFDALAVFDPDVVTGPDGTATVTVPLPDSLTRYRVMVVATDSAKRFGSAESNITTQLALIARPSAPRFLNFGDTFELPVVVQNLSDEDMTVDVALEATNLSLPGVTGKRVTVPANDRVEVRFEAEADQVGTAQFRVVAVSGEHTDAITTELPVYTPATTESFATYGVVDDGAVVQPIVSPEGVFPQFGGLEIDTSSTALQSLTDAVLYLHEYEYESVDAYASRILAIAALRDVLEAFSTEALPSAAEIDAAVAKDLASLATFQNDDGGFAGWERGRPSEPYRSIQATHALVAARDAGYTVDESTLQIALNYLGDIEQYYPAEMSRLTQNTLSAYALHVRDLAGDKDGAKATKLYTGAGDKIGLDGLAWLWPIIDDGATSAEIGRRIANAAVETAGAATFSTDYGDEAYVLLYSDRRTDGIVLDALIEKDPTSDLIPKVVAGLLANQVEGRWDNVQENAFILLALNSYFDTFEATDPDFVARVWLGDTYAAEHEYHGRSTDRSQTLIPMASLLDAGDSDVIVAKDGTGRLYYRLGLRYAPNDLDLDPLDRGFEVSRRYEAIDDPADVSQDSNGVWHIAVGARVRVSLSVVADSRRTNMALIDPLPAGLEALNPELAVSQPLPFEPREPGEIEGPGFYEGDVPAESFAEPGYGIGYWQGVWYDYDNLRDDRAEAMASLMPAGTYGYDYIARATTPGRFVVPPTRAEEIYAPETFGRAGSDIVVVS